MKILKEQIHSIYTERPIIFNARNDLNCRDQETI
jgi:hypothetical protein